MTMDYSSINYLAVLAATFAAFILGSLWYTVLFGKAWQKELGFTDEYLKKGNMAAIFGSSFLLMFIMSWGMAWFINVHGENDVNWLWGMVYGLFIGLFFVGASYGINMLYQRRSFKLWAIDSFYQILFLGMQGAILGAWH
ncbi:MAG: DUF1761 domain-containing protein [Marinilabiliales bacterium]|nr:MAG: DUF1761 domain-containing protein [Marinilabiliales bacterium]